MLQPFILGIVSRLSYVVVSIMILSCGGPERNILAPVNPSRDNLDTGNLDDKNSPLATQTPTQTFTFSPTSTFTFTPQPTITPLPQETNTPVPDTIATATATPSFTPIPTKTHTLIPTGTSTPTNTNTPSPTPSIVPTNTPSSNPTPSPSPSPSQTPITSTACADSMWGENTISGVSGPIGGGKISRVYDGSQADYIVKDKAQLIAALKVANYGDIIFMPKNTIIDWSNEAAQGISIDIPAGVSLVGSRGVDPDDQIALITTYKYKNEYAVIRLDEERSTVAGFRLEGPEKYPYKDLKKIIENNVSLGIASSGKNNLVLNMIIRNYSPFRHGNFRRQQYHPTWNNRH